MCSSPGSSEALHNPQRKSGLYMLCFSVRGAAAVVVLASTARSVRDVDVARVVDVDAAFGGHVFHHRPSITAWIRWTSFNDGAPVG